MWINNIKLNNFRNYNNKEINLHENINVFFGENAQGKTNIIESIFLCSIGKSFRSSKDSELIKFGENYAKIEIYFHKSDRDGDIEIGIANKKNMKKVIEQEI